MNKLLKINGDDGYMYASTYNRKGKGWEAFIHGTGWKTYKKAEEIEVEPPTDFISLMVATYCFGEDVAGDLIAPNMCTEQAWKLAYFARWVWLKTYEAGLMLPDTGFAEFLRCERRLAMMGYYTLDVVETDKLLMKAYPEEYLEGMSMADFITLKFGAETCEVYRVLLA